MVGHDRIAPDPNVLGGKPAVRGARLAVDFNLGRLARWRAQEQILSKYPALTPEALGAVFRAPLTFSTKRS